MAMAILAVGMSFISGAHAASSEKVLYAFKGGNDGQSPMANLVFDKAGNIYGTTRYGGANDEGTVFELTPKTGGKWTQSTIHTFGTGKDGIEPQGALLIDAAGSLYGTAAGGGTKGAGVVYKLDPIAGGKWKETVLHNFSGRLDGGHPFGNLIFDGGGNLYGTTSEGGSHEYGAVFELTPGTNGKWTNKTLHSFNDNGHDGYGPLAGLVFDATGNLYGTTYQGGSKRYGIVFQLVLGSNGTWTEHIIHNFNPANGHDGAYSDAALAVDLQGHLYGTTNSGGKSEFYGVAFELTPETGSILHSFSGGDDGSEPDAGLILDAAGNLYGTTSVGSKNGVVFELTPGTGGKWTETVLHRFSSTSDGSEPYAGVVFDTSGLLYGTTKIGGANGMGVVFQIQP
jgi:uncharacterized repeat protein (TIGR03803 family)